MTEKLEKSTHSHPELVSASITKGRHAAFTLAEVLITLAVIGIVAALTIPALVQNHNEKAWSTAKDLFDKKLVEVTRRMNIDGVMTGYNTTEAYFDTFRKYMKIVKSCDSSNINKCYSPKILSTGKDGKIEVTTSDLKKAKNLGHDDWRTNTTAYVIADGTTIIMSYNPNCESVDPYSAKGQSGQVYCMAMIIDHNGKKGPNQVTKDIELKNATISTCDNPIGNMCWSTDFWAFRAVDTCDGNNPYDPYYTSSTNSNCSTNYWAGALQTCDELGMKLPSRAELAQLASILYGAQIGENEDYEGPMLSEYETILSFPYYNTEYWSNQDEYWYHDLAYYRMFGPINTEGNNKTAVKSSEFRAICIEN